MNDPNLKDPSAAPAAFTGTASAEEKQWAMFAHLSALLGGLVTSAGEAALASLSGH